MTTDVDSAAPVRILGFVNHIAPAPDIEESIARALDWGVDVIVAQGTGSDWGPYWLGSGEQVAANVAENVRPYLRAARTHGIPFVFSLGIAGANVHLDRCLHQLDALCVEEGWDLEVGVIRSELSKEFVGDSIDAGARIAPATEGAGLAEPLTRADVDAVERLVALIGCEPSAPHLPVVSTGSLPGVRSTSDCSWPIRCSAAYPRLLRRTLGSSWSAAGSPSSPATPGSASGPASTPRASRCARRIRGTT